MSARCRVVAAAALVALWGCGGAATLVVKPPITEGCKSNGLKGCDEIVDGVMLYLDGKHDEGVAKISTGAAKNAPDDVRKYAAAVKAIASLPGTGEYGQSIVEIADLLDGTAYSKDTSHPKPAAEARTDSVPAAKSTVVPEAVAVGPNDAQLRAGTHFPSDGKGRECPRTALWGSGACRVVKAFIGPVVVTELLSSGDCPDELFVVAGDVATPEWVILSRAGQPLSLHQMGLVVASDVPLWIGARSASGQLRSDLKCSVTWAGRKPSGPALEVAAAVSPASSPNSAAATATPKDSAPAASTNTTATPSRSTSKSKDPSTATDKDADPSPANNAKKPVTGAFDAEAAAGALRSIELIKCKVAGGPRGEGHVVVTFGSDGVVSEVTVDRGAFVGSPVERCIVGQFQKASVPPFRGDSVVVGKTFRID